SWPGGAPGRGSGPRRGSGTPWPGAGRRARRPRPQARAHQASLAVYPSEVGPRYKGRVSSEVVTFDAGQTLVELDLDFLATRLGERNVVVAASALAAAAPEAWRRYDALVEAGGSHPWHAFMDALLAGAGVRER